MNPTGVACGWSARGRRRSGLYRVDPLAGDEVDDPPGDGDGVVAETLVVAAAQRDVDRALDPALPARVEEDGEQPLVKVVHDVVVPLELRGHLEVAPGDHARALGDDPLCDLAHLENGGVQRR